MTTSFSTNARSTSDPNAFLALGTNLGNLLENLVDGVRLLTHDGSVELCGAAGLYETSPVGGPTGQANFCNTVVSIYTEKTAGALLDHVMQVEQAMGRIRNEASGPRIIDVDVLLHDSNVLDTPTLTLPHPRMHLRRFVLVPLAELAPQLRHPVLNKSITSLLDQLPADDHTIRRVGSSDWTDARN